MQKGVKKKKGRTPHFKTSLITEKRHTPCWEPVFEWRIIKDICIKMTELLIARVNWERNIWESRHVGGTNFTLCQRIRCLMWKFDIRPWIQYRYSVINDLFTVTQKTLHYPEFPDVLVSLTCSQTRPYKDFRISITCRTSCTRIYVVGGVPADKTKKVVYDLTHIGGGNFSGVLTTCLLSYNSRNQCRIWFYDFLLH
jgi:hypothetical protein